MITSELTDEQTEVAAAGAGTRQLVTAGPGTGKTHTLVARIGHLVENEDIHPGGILALSFSRAAVGELRRRLRATGEDAGRVAPVTFDSFATRVLAEVDPGGAWTQQSFDGRIHEAIGRVGDIAELLSTIEHVFIDELQDLVGVRMRFVKALLPHVDAGFTLLGDPAQGIYDFALGDGETPENAGAPALYRWVRDTYGDELLDRTLTVNHRARSELAKRAASLGGIVVADSAAAMQQLLGILAEAPRLTSLGLLRNATVDERTAVLCRNNGHALWVSRHLRRDDVDHVVQRGATNRNVAPWIAQIVMAAGGGILSRGRFDNMLGKIGIEVENTDELWFPLRRIARDELGVDLERLVQRLRQGFIPDELYSLRYSPITVSTVHRSKGLEFDRVIVIDDGWRAPFDEEDARTLFVAESRTIETLTSAALPELQGRLLVDKWTDRWVDAGWEHWKRHGMEIRPTDIDTLTPAGSFMLNVDATTVQERLAHDVQLADPVHLELVRPKIGEPGAFYKVVWRDQPIAMASSQFGLDLMRVLKASKSWTYPRRIEEISIDAIRTVGGDAAVTNQEGLGPGGAWLVPSLVGIGRFIWEDGR